MAMPNRIFFVGWVWAVCASFLSLWASLFTSCIHEWISCAYKKKRNLPHYLYRLMKLMSYLVGYLMTLVFDL